MFGAMQGDTYNENQLIHLKNWLIDFICVCCGHLGTIYEC